MHVNDVRRDCVRCEFHRVVRRYFFSEEHMTLDLNKYRQQLKCDIEEIIEEHGHRGKITHEELYVRIMLKYNLTSDELCEVLGKLTPDDGTGLRYKQ